MDDVKRTPSKTDDSSCATTQHTTTTPVAPTGNTSDELIIPEQEQTLSKDESGPSADHTFISTLHFTEADSMILGLTSAEYSRFMAGKEYYDGKILNPECTILNHSPLPFAARTFLEDRIAEKHPDCGCDSAFGYNDDGEVRHYGEDCPFR